MITDATHDWDDRAGLFRVFVTREGEDEAKPLDKPWSQFDPGEEGRLYLAAMRANPKDFLDSRADKLAGWEKEGPARRAARAVREEIKRARRGEPAPTLEEVSGVLEVARALRPRRKGARS